MAIWIKVEHTTKMKDFGECVIKERKTPININSYINIRLKPAKIKTFTEYVKTLIHEFVHALHFILKDQELFEATSPSEETYCRELENSSILAWYLLREKKKKRKKK